MRIRVAARDVPVPPQVGLASLRARLLVHRCWLRALITQLWVLVLQIRVLIPQLWVLVMQIKILITQLWVLQLMAPNAYRSRKPTHACAVAAVRCSPTRSSRRETSKSPRARPLASRRRQHRHRLLCPPPPTLRHRHRRLRRGLCRGRRRHRRSLARRPHRTPPACSHICARTERHLRQDRATSARRYGCMGRRQIVGVLSGSFTDGAAAGAQYAATRARAHTRTPI